MARGNEASTLPPEDWIELIHRGEEDLAAGRTISAALLLAEMRARNEQTTARLAKKAPGER